VKKDKDRVTVAFCANASGTHKLKLIVLGKAAEPCCFETLNIFDPNSLVWYSSNKKAWTNTAIFQAWLKGLIGRRALPSVTFSFSLTITPATPPTEWT